MRERKRVLEREKECSDEREKEIVLDSVREIEC